MKVKYKILSVDEKENNFVVRYFTDLLTEDDLASEYDIDGFIVRDANEYPIRCRTDVNFSIYDENQSTMENVKSLIESSAPFMWLRSMEKVKTNTSPSMANVISLLNVTKDFEANDSIFNPSIIPGEISIESDVILKGNLSVTGNIVSNTTQ